MSQADTTHVPSSRTQSVPGAAIEAVVAIVRAFMGSLLAISTAAVFGVVALVGIAGVSAGAAVTMVSVAFNAMLLSLVVLGNLGGREDDQ